MTTSTACSPRSERRTRAAVRADRACAPYVREVDESGVEQREQLGGVERGRPERDPFHLR